MRKLLAILLCCMPALAATQRYISTSGSDGGGNNCSVMGSPCATPQYALTQSSPDDTINCPDGVYHFTQTWFPATNGTNGHPITFLGTGTSGGCVFSGNYSGSLGTFVDEGSCGTNCEDWDVALDPATYPKFESLFYGKAGQPLVRRYVPTLFVNNANPSANDARICIGNEGTQLTQGQADAVASGASPIFPVWQSGHVYAAGATITIGGNSVLYANNAGTSGSVQPTVPAIRWTQTASDNGIIWTVVSNVIHSAFISSPCGTSQRAIVNIQGNGTTVTVNCGNVTTTGCNVYVGEVINISGTTTYDGNATVVSSTPTSGLFTYTGGGTGVVSAGFVNVSTPYMRFNGFLYNTSDPANGGNPDITCTAAGIKLGDISIVDAEHWTMGIGRLAFANCGTGNYGGQAFAQMTGPTGLSNGMAGFIPGHDLDIRNDPANKQAGEWYLDRCPSTSHCTTPDASWMLHIYADTSKGELPNSDQIAFSVIPPGSPQLIYIDNGHDLTFNNIAFTGDNWMPPPSGDPDSQGMPMIPDAIGLHNSSRITFNNVQIYHMQGWGLGMHANSANNLVENSALYGLGSGGLRVGDTATSNDTNANTPDSNTIQNTTLDYYGDIETSGEATGYWIGDAHKTVLKNFRCAEGYVGCIALGEGLNRGAKNDGSNLAYFIYGNWVTYGVMWGRGFRNGGQLSAILGDFGAVHAATNLSTLAPTTGQPANASCDPLDVTNTYANHFCHIVAHDFGSNFTDQTDQGVQLFYLDGGSSNTEYGYLLGYRSGHRCFTNTGASNASPWSAQYVPTYNIMYGSLLVGCGAAPYNGVQSGGAVPGLYNHQANQANAFSLLNNIWIYNSDIGPTSQKGLVMGGAQWGPFDGLSANVTAGGSGYTGTTCTIAGTGTGAICTPTVVAGVVTAVALSATGGMQSGYTGTPTCTLHGTTGSGATCTVAAYQTQIIGTLPVNATTRFNIDFNAYYDLAGRTPIFHTCTTATCAGFTNYTGIPWGPVSEEDTHSLMGSAANPGLVNPNFGVDNFNMTNPPALFAGYQWDYSLAGPTAALVASIPPEASAYRPRYICAGIGGSCTHSDFYTVVAPGGFTTFGGYPGSGSTTIKGGTTGGGE